MLWSQAYRTSLRALLLNSLCLIQWTTSFQTPFSPPQIRLSFVDVVQADPVFHHLLDFLSSVPQFSCPLYISTTTFAHHLEPVNDGFSHCICLWIMHLYSIEYMYTSGFCVWCRTSCDHGFWHIIEFNQSAGPLLAATLLKKTAGIFCQMLCLELFTYVYLCVCMFFALELLVDGVFATDWWLLPCPTHLGPVSDEAAPCHPAALKPEWPQAFALWTSQLMG